MSLPLKRAQPFLVQHLEADVEGEVLAVRVLSALLCGGAPLSQSRGECILPATLEKAQLGRSPSCQLCQPKKACQGVWTGRWLVQMGHLPSLGGPSQFEASVPPSSKAGPSKGRAWLGPILCCPIRQSLPYGLKAVFAKYSVLLWQELWKAEGPAPFRATLRSHTFRPHCGQVSGYC